MKERKLENMVQTILGF